MPGQFVGLVLAGVAGGLTGSVAGLASLVTYPALLAVGLSPVAANVTNTVALVFNSVGSVSASRPELAGRRRLLIPLAVAAVGGGLVGAGLLLAVPATSFAVIVPWLIAFASAAILIPRRPASLGDTDRHRRSLLWATALIGVYGGYFGAAAGVLMLAALLAMTGEGLARSNAAKNLLLGLSNGVAALYFSVAGPVHWAVVLPLALGLFTGGRLGPAVVRRLPAMPLRIVIAAAGVGLACYLGTQAYS